MNKSFSKAVVLKTTGKGKVSLKIKKLQPRKTYWMRARTYKKIGGIKHYSQWSNAKKVRVK